MFIEEIVEPIEVIALFRQGKLSPLKFRWREQVYRVTRINGAWNRNEGQNRLFHYAVMSDNTDIYELSYNECSQSWRIEKVSLNEGMRAEG
ncbi:hypothetical protein KKC97_01350 [bacterium]|nr:hypothetical protein [bacterium]MBU1919711.1 hypothetical protein [bacterium]